MNGSFNVPNCILTHSSEVKNIIVALIKVHIFKTFGECIVYKLRYSLHSTHIISVSYTCTKTVDFDSEPILIEPPFSSNETIKYVTPTDLIDNISEPAYNVIVHVENKKKSIKTSSTKTFKNKKKPRKTTSI